MLKLITLMFTLIPAIFVGSCTMDLKPISVNLTAANVYVLDTDTGDVIYQKKDGDRIAPASTVKMLAALTALDHCAVDDVITVGSEITLIDDDASRAWLNEGDTLTVRQLLVAMLLPSGNDAAYTLAVNVGKKISGEDGIETNRAIELFVEEMNKKANETGAESSNFATPDGYDAPGQYTTAFDLARIAEACLGNDVLSGIMGSSEIYDTWVNGREVTYHNTNELIDPAGSFYYAGAIGLKTGNTADAGACVVAAAYINGHTYICVVMGSTEEDRFSDCLTVFNAIEEIEG